MNNHKNPFCHLTFLSWLPLCYRAWFFLFLVKCVLHFANLMLEYLFWTLLSNNFPTWGSHFGYGLVSVLISISSSPLLMQFWSECTAQKDIVTAVLGNFVWILNPNRTRFCYSECWYPISSVFIAHQRLGVCLSVTENWAYLRFSNLPLKIDGGVDVWLRGELGLVIPRS